MNISTTALATALVEARGITREFRMSGRIVQVLRGIDLTIGQGEFVALRGRSGSGKTTLLNLLVGLDDPTQGTISILGQDVRHLNENARATLRRQQIGLLFQNAHLIPTLTALENVELALHILKVPARERRKRALEALESVALTGRAEHRGLELSGGEQQRVALARALVHQPRLLIADEPTGNLDSQTGQKMILLLREIVQTTGVGLLIATHDFEIVNAASRVLKIEDGRIM